MPGTTASLRIEYEPKMRLVGEGDWRDDVLGGLAQLRALQRALEKGMRDVVSRSRAAGHSWAEIAAVLELDEHDARRRFEA